MGCSTLTAFAAAAPPLPNNPGGGSDLFFGRLSSPATLAPGQSYSRTFRANLPQDLSGQYRLKVISDENSSQLEFNIANNTAFSNAFTVTLAPYADLQVTSVSAPDSPEAKAFLDIAEKVAAALKTADRAAPKITYE